MKIFKAIRKQDGTVTKTKLNTNLEIQKISQCKS